jgi:sugar/nucleoside kinase (ribokinase family)
MEVQVAERLEATYRGINELRFVVIGAYVADCFVAAPRLPRWGEEYEVRSIQTSPGGKALNQAVALARLGAHVTAIGAVGEDGLGRDIMSALTREGIETEFSSRARRPPLRSVSALWVTTGRPHLCGTSMKV